MEDAPAPAQTAARDAVDTLVAPPITVVMVAHEPGPWFDETLTSLAEQDYPNLRFVFIDAGTTNAVPDQVRAYFPEAQIFPLLANPGFSAAANEIVDADGLAPYLLLCHDDVVFEPDAIRRLFEEAIRSNAGVLGPKIVDWDDPRLIREVGIGVDKTGVRSPYAEPGEFDQEQHDAVRDVFAVSSTAMLVRTDLFVALGGFDEVMAFQGEDVDLCWRAHIAGARVMVVPLAVVRHRERMSTDERRSEGKGSGGLKQLRQRHQVRMLLSNYATGHLLRVLPQAMIAAVASLAHAVFRGRFERVGHLVSSWTWNLGNLGSLLAKRRQVARLRQLSDSEVRRFQVPGFHAVNSFIQQRADADADPDARASRTQEALAFTRTTAGQLVAGVWISVVVVLAFGSRHLLTRGIPVINEFARFPESTTDLWGEWLSGLRGSGLGPEGFGPVGHGLLAAFGTVFLGQMGLLRTVLTIGMLAIGAIGAVRLVAPFDSLAARAIAPWIYVALPLPYNALVAGSWGGLVLYGLLPWCMRWLAATAGIAPYTAPERIDQRLRLVVGLGVLTALAAVVVPFVLALILLVAAGTIIGGFVAGSAGRAVSVMLTAIGAIAIAVALHIPWALNFFNAQGWAMFGGTRSGQPGELGALDLIRLATGPHGSGLLGWSIVVVAGLSLILASGDRLVWAIRGWMIALGSFGLAWVDQLGIVGASLPRPEVLLAPAALGLAIAATMLVIAVERDLGSYRFGIRQILPAFAIVSLLAAAVAGIGAAFDGGWNVARGGYETALRFAEDEQADNARLLWVGDADVLPVGGWSYEEATIGVTSSTVPSVVELWAHPDSDGEQVLKEVLDTAMSGGTNRVGRLLAPLGIRYIVVVERRAPAPFASQAIDVPPAVGNVLARQLDFEEVNVRDGMTVYRNTSWTPIISELDIGTASKVTSPTEVQVAATDLSGAPGRFVPESPRRWTGTVTQDTEIQQAVASSRRWTLTTDTATSTTAFQSRGYGWSNVFEPASSGPAVLEYSTTPTYRFLMAAQALLWLVALAVMLFGPRRIQR